MKNQNHDKRRNFSMMPYTLEYEFQNTPYQDVYKRQTFKVYKKGKSGLHNLASPGIDMTTASSLILFPVADVYKIQLSNTPQKTAFQYKHPLQISNHLFLIVKWS